MIDLKKIVNSTDFLEKLRKQVPENLREEWDKYIEMEIERHDKLAKKIVTEIQKPQGVDDASESS